MRLVITVLVVVTVAALISNMVTRANQLVAAPPEVVIPAGRLNHAMSRAYVLAEQHTDPFLAFQELCYAKAYLRSLRCLMTDSEIQEAFSVNIRRVGGELDRLEQDALRRLPEAPRTAVDAGFIP